MCGRYTLSASAREIAEAFGLDGPPPDIEPRFNIAPSQDVPVVLADEGGNRHLEMLRWGLIPRWAKDPGAVKAQINARSETAFEKPFFRDAFRRRRGLQIATGYLEWTSGKGGPKTPHFFRLKGGEPFAFAGLYEEWGRGDEALKTCALLTTDANTLGAKVHGRMPVILDPADYEMWLDPTFDDAEALRELLRPYPEDLMEECPVSRAINSPSAQGPELVEPAPAAP
jgi:putative SOS response-associated peptidase YedK